MKRKQPEQVFHKAVAEYLDAALPPSCWWTTFPAGGGGKARGGQLKAMGLRAGVPDILVLHRYARMIVHVIWLELKAPKGRPPSKVQIATHNALEGVDDWAVSVHVCRTLDEVESALRDECIPLRAKVAA